MKLKTILIVLGTLAIPVLFLLLGAIHPEEIPSLHLSIPNCDESPIFDLTWPPATVLPAPPQNYCDLTSIQIWLLDKNGQKIRSVWHIRRLPDGDGALKFVTYGKTPFKWEQLQEAEPLKRGEIYYFGGEKVFVREYDGSYKVLPGRYYYPQVIAAELLRLKEPRHVSDASNR